jgi:hypothetical protein
MKDLKRTLLASGLSLAVGAGSVLSQTNPAASAPAAQPVAPTAKPPPTGQAPIPERPVVIPPAAKPQGRNLPEPPARPDRHAPSEAVKDLVRDFQAARQAFLNQQKELQRQLKHATREDREAIRKQLKENLQIWLEQQKAQLQELRDQARDLRSNLPAISDVIDSAKGEGRGR